MDCLGDQTVSVYRREADGVVRRVFHRCCYTHTARLVRHERYERLERQCLLVLPGAVELKPGDRVFEGLGPEQVDWDSFLPVSVPGLSEVSWVRQYAVDGKIHHTEAGR